MEISFKTNSGIKTQKFSFVSTKSNSDQTQPVAVEPVSSFKIDEENSVGIFTLNKCKGDEEYYESVYEFFDEVVSNSVRNIIIDLRDNSGGNIGIEMEFVIGLDACMKNFDLDNFTFGKWEIRTEDGIKVEENGENLLLKEGYKLKDLRFDTDEKYVLDRKVFILTSNWTYSAGMLFARNFSDAKLATIIGEIPGNSPTCFTDIYNHEYYTPNSKLKFWVTCKKTYRPDETKDPERLIPDVQVPSCYAMRKAYELIKAENKKCNKENMNVGIQE